MARVQAPRKSTYIHTHTRTHPSSERQILHVAGRGITVAMATAGAGNDFVVVGVAVRIRHVRGTVHDEDKRLPFRVKYTTIVVVRVDLLLLPLADLLVVGSLVIVLLVVGFLVVVVFLMMDLLVLLVVVLLVVVLLVVVLLVMTLIFFCLGPTTRSSYTYMYACMCACVHVCV